MNHECQSEGRHAGDERLYQGKYESSPCDHVYKRTKPVIYREAY